MTTGPSPTADETRPAPAPVDPGAPPIIFEAIVKQLCVAASYNRTEVTLAPHVLYTRHGEMYVDAITVDRDGRPPKEVKVGAFKLAGLNPLRLTARRFEKSELFHAKDPKYRDVTLMAVDA